ncbi:5'-nucleotidase SurE [Roseimaritima multifibrata]|uniref:5'-nucleotidase SurE n=1 Tax=Roseimaritima multifibrata TaxID=1930274 RepID=A0A517MBG6_9BACT|nr:5'/3'-nucleotidase SurE [Roseimaritima multifibrata]QDS92236.1 5'-nucleotidase SurE [Roseimaritima multifibrata]
MKILLTNDDGVYAPGLAALESQLRHLGEVFVAAPATEQSGVGHSITFLTPLVCKKIILPDRRTVWAVEGSPADCVKLAIAELCPWRPDIVVSGINSGLNAGINVLYSGTVAAAIEGAFFGITSCAVSLEYAPDADFQAAAVIARNVIGGIASKPSSEGGLFNINIPTEATNHAAEVKVVPMGLAQYGDRYEKRQDPGGRDYYWAVWHAPEKPPAADTDVTELSDGHVTVSPLKFDLTRRELLEEMQDWNLRS